MSTFTPNWTPEEAANTLRSRMTGTGRVYVLNRSVAKSGMSRRVSLFIVRNGELDDITVLAAAVLGEKVRSEDHSIQVHGVGMNMHWHTVNRLSDKLYGSNPVGGNRGHLRADVQYELSYETI